VTRDVLILVHPGSCCGSANFSIGKSADSLRAALAARLSAWRGSLLVIGGDLSDELPQFPELEGAVNEALLESSRAGHFADEVRGQDGSRHDQRYQARKFAREQFPDKAAVRFLVTGAWHYPDLDGGNGGCAGSVVAALHKLGYAAEYDATVFVG
jgi:hypothetical protein